LSCHVRLIWLFDAVVATKFDGGAGDSFTVNMVLDCPPPGALLITKKTRSPMAALAAMVRFAVKLVELFTVVELTAMPLPTFTEVTPSIKFVPVKTTSSVCKRLPLVGERFVKVGAGLNVVALLSLEKDEGPTLFSARTRYV